MEFEVGEYYKSKFNNIIVRCINPRGRSNGSFEGVIANHNGPSFSGGISDEWSKSYFEEYHEPKETVITLQNGHKYNIPKGCKATITDNVIEIEEDIRYLKWSNGKKSKYFRVSSDKCLVVSKNENQPNVIWSLDSYTTYNSDEVVNSTKEEFEEVYNKAMEALKL